MLFFSPLKTGTPMAVLDVPVAPALRVILLSLPCNMLSINAVDLGFLSVFISDQGRELINQVTRALFETEHRMTTAYHSQVHMTVL